MEQDPSTIRRHHRIYSTGRMEQQETCAVLSKAFSLFERQPSRSQHPDSKRRFRVWAHTYYSVLTHYQRLIKDPKGTQIRRNALESYEIHSSHWSGSTYMYTAVAEVGSSVRSGGYLYIYISVVHTTGRSENTAPKKNRFT